MASRRRDQAFDRIVGRQIARARESAGLNQAQLAALVGTDQGTVSKLERGSLRLSPSRASLIAGALGVSIDYLFGRVSNDNTPSTTAD